MTADIRVLHVDDEPDFLSLTAEYLEREDDRLSVETATSDEVALDILAEREIDCIISDYDMPGMDGLEFFRTLRDDFPDIPFILFTGKGSEAVAAEAISAGVSDYLQKGGSERFSLLANRITNLVNKRRSRVTAESRADQQRVVANLGQQALGGASVQSLCEQAVSAVAETLHTEYAKVLKYRPEENEFLLTAGAGLQAGLVGEATVGTGDHSQAGHTLESQAPVIVEDLRTESRFQGPPLLTDHDVKSGISVLIGSTAEPWGILGAHSTETTQFTADDVNFMQSVANVLAEAIEQREHDDALTQERDRFRTIFEGALDAIVIADDEWRFIDANEPATTLFGLSHEELVGESIRAFTPDDYDFDTAWEQFTQSESQRGEFPLVRADGTERIVEFSATPDIAPGKHLSIFRDITDRKEREAQLTERVKESEAIRRTVEVVEGHSGEPAALLQSVCEFLPESFQYPELTEVKLVYGDQAVETDQFQQTDARSHAETETTNGSRLRLEVGLISDETDRTPDFIDQELALIRTIAAFLREYFDKEEQLVTHETAIHRYQTILTHLSDYVMIVDANAEIDYISPAVEKVTGYEPDELVGTSAFEYVHDADQEEAAQAFTKTLEEPEKEVTAEFRTTTADGSVRWIEARGRYYFDEPLIDGLLVAVRDITDRKERERQYEAIFNQTYQFTGLMEPDGTLLEANETALEFGGLSREDIIGKKMWEADWFQLSEETSDRARKAVQKAANGEFVRHELPVQGANEEVIIDFSVRPVTDEDGTVVLLIPEGRDITELKDREAELTEHLLRAVDQLYTADSTDECYEITIETAVSILGFDWCTLTAPTAGGEYFEIVSVSAEAPVEVGDQPFKIDEGVAGHVYQTKEPSIVTNATEEQRGEPISEDIRSALTIPVGEWGVFQAVGTEFEAFDDTDRRHAELLVAAMQTAIDRIESETALAQRNERLEEFTSVVSHDLRNPLSVAQLRVDLATADCDSEHLALAANSLDRMEMLIEDLLTLADQGQRIGETEIVSLQAVAQQCRTTVDMADAELAIETDLRLHADRSRLQQAIENLVRNAVQHGGSAVTVSFGSVENGFYVEDTGPGIPETERTRVFETGFSANSDSTGYGLAIVKEIVEAHGWDIEVTDGADGGARFEITGVDIVE